MKVFCVFKGNHYEGSELVGVYDCVDKALSHAHGLMKLKRKYRDSEKWARLGLEYQWRCYYKDDNKDSETYNEFTPRLWDELVVIEEREVL